MYAVNNLVYEFVLTLLQSSNVLQFHSKNPFNSNLHKKNIPSIYPWTCLSNSLSPYFSRDVKDLKHNAPINKPRAGGWGGGVRAVGGDLTAKSIPSVGGLIEYLCSGSGRLLFFWQRDWDQVSVCLQSVFDLFWQRRGV